MNWQALLHNKWALAGLAGAAGLGAFVLIRRKQTTGSSSTSTDTSSTGSGSLSSSFPDTAGTDVATWLGNQEGTLAQQNADFLKSLQDTLGAVAKVPTSGAPTPTPTPTPAAPVAGAPRVSTPNPTVTVAKYTSSNPAWNSTLSGIAAHEHTTVAALMKLNPTITNPNLIRTGATIRVH